MRTVGKLRGTAHRVATASAAVTALLTLTGCQAVAEWGLGALEEPTVVDLRNDSALDLMNRRHIGVPSGFEFVKGREWPASSVGMSAYAIRLSGSEKSYITLRSAQIYKSLGDFQDVFCESVTLPRSRLDLNWLGYSCPPGTIVRVARMEGRAASDDVSQGETAAVLARGYHETRLIVVNTGT